MSARSVFPSSARRIAIVAGLLAAALLMGAMLGTPALAQSLWSDRGGSLVSDLKARRAGDIVTIVVDEQSSAEKRANTDLSRDSSFNSTLTPPGFQRPRALREFLLNLSASGEAESNFEGRGSTTRTDRTTAQISAKVMRVLENGNLVIEGRRLVTVHDENQTIVVSGVVRPVDIQADNTVRSAFIADAEVRVEGQGSISQRQRPGFLHRLFDWLGLH